ncbi:MAG: TetR/AcrR family transcriptional regulator [Anaerolineae bacterium]|jgi:AcrR family transcriptional regulator|nr:TetR/AcrR family transcriptional regulator [Anaerolineae bacterium]
MNESLSKGDQARVEIMEAAKRLFISQGYNGTSMRAIARAAGDRAVAGLYNHFPTKEAIFRALIEETNPYFELLDTLEGIMDESDTAPEYVEAALATVLKMMPKHFDFIELAQIDLREFESSHIRHVLEGRVFPRLFELMIRLQQKPGLKPLNMLVVMRIMASLVIGYVITDQLGAGSVFGQLGPDEWAHGFAEAILYGIAEPDAR